MIINKISTELVLAKTLQVSYIGMQTQEVAIKHNLKIVLKADAAMLDEVVVVAYGAAKRAHWPVLIEIVKADQVIQSTGK